MAFLQTISGSYLPPATLTVVLREQLLDLVSIISPYATPVLNIMARRTADSPIHQWITDVLPNLVLNNTAGSIDVDGVNVQGILEGFDNPSFGSNYPYTGQPQRQTNYVQMWAAKVGISDTLKRTSPVGIRDPYNWELMKATRVVGKAMERRFFDNLSANAAYSAGSASDPRRARSLYDFKTALNTGDPILNLVTAGGVITTAVVDDGMEVAFNAGGEPDYLVVSPGVKVDFSNAMRAIASGGASNIGIINQSYIGAAEQKIVKSVDIYEGDFGPLAVLVSRQVPQSNVTTGGGKAWLLEKAKLGYATFEPVHHIPLAKTGHNTKGVVVGQGTFEILNAAALTCIENVTT